MTQPKENRPGGGTGATSRSAHHSTTADAPESTVTARIPHLTAAEIAESRPLYLLIVKTPADRLMRRTYLSLPAAEKAVRRAQSRGSAATLELHRVVPYTVGRELHGLEDGGAL